MIENQSDEAVKEVAATPSGPTVSKRRVKQEFSLIESLKHIGEDGHEAVSCVSGCRYGEVRHSWHECLEKCVSNHLLRSTLSAMLPAEHHAPPGVDAELPGELLLPPAAKRKVLLSAMRSSEL